jgi:hypothetical protein
MQPGDVAPLVGAVVYLRVMYQITKQALGDLGSFVRLVKLDDDDYTVIVRRPEDGRLEHRYIGPDPAKAEEIFASEAERISGTKSDD